MDFFGEGDFIFVEKVPRAVAYDFGWRVTKDVLDTVGAELDASICRQV